MKRKLIPVNNGHDLAVTVEIDRPDAQIQGRPVREKARCVITQTILDRWLARGGIDERQWRAGDRLRATIVRAGLMPRVTRDPRRHHRGTQADPTLLLPMGEVQAAARFELRRALAALPKRLAGLAYAVCADHETPGDYVARDGLKRRQAETLGRDRLRLALNLLAEFWGL